MTLSDLGSATVRELWALLDEIQEMGFSLNPLDLAHNIGVLAGIIERVWKIASEPPPGVPAEIEAAAVSWRRIRDAMDTHAGDLQAMDVTTWWRGAAGVGCAATVRRLARRYEDAAPLAERAYRSLATYGDEIASAQQRHAQMGDHLRAAAAQLRPCLPWEIADLIRRVIEEIVEAVQAAIDAYSRADAATEDCEAALRAVGDQMPFPAGQVPGMSAFELMDFQDAPTGRRPLVGDVLQRARDHYDALGDGAREVVDELLASAASPEHRAWILATLATGASLETLANFADRIAGESGRDLALLLDPTQHTLKQQSSTTCGSASLVVARMLNDPVYALKVLGGYDATTGASDDTTLTDRFEAEEADVMRRTNAAKDSTGLRMPWPPALGTPPWGAAEEMNGAAGNGSGGYGVQMIDSGSPADRQQAYDALARAATDGRPAPLYVGDETIPRHVVLVVGVTDTGLSVYEPGAGTIVQVSETDFVSGDVSDLGWSRPWAAVAP